MKDRIGVLIVDDHRVVRAGIRGMLAGEEDIDVVGEATNGQEAVDLAGDLDPHVVLMDLNMPGVDGIAAAKALRTSLPETHVLVLTTYDTDADISSAIDAGAVGYVLKDAPREELLHAIRQAAKGESVLSPSVAAKVMGRLRSGGQESLSPRELEVLEQVARGATNQEIAWHLHVSQATVKTHLIHIFDKLGVSDRTAAATRALEQGIIRLEE